MQKRRRFRQSTTLEQRLSGRARNLRDEAQRLPPRAERENLLRKARQLDTVSNMTELLTAAHALPPT